MSLIEQVNAGIMTAMKAKDQDRLRALRGIKSAFLLLKTAEGVTEVTDDMCIKALQKMAMGGVADGKLISEAVKKLLA